MNESTSGIKIHIKRFALFLGLALVALLLSVIPKEKKSPDAKEHTLYDNAGENALIPTARADDIGGIGLTGGCAATSCSCGK